MKTYLINLPHRTDRLNLAIPELNRQGIIPEVWPAEVGLKETMIELFRDALNAGHEYIQVFEDDVQFINPYKLPGYSGKDLYFLGGNVFGEVSKDGLLSKCYANHAVIYSRLSIARLLALYVCGDPRPTDVIVNEEIISRGNSYIVYPMQCIQRSGYSDMEKRNVDYSHVWKRIEKWRTNH